MSIPPATPVRFPSGVVYALAAAALFGASTPLSKLLLSEVSPVLLAGLLYLGSGVGLSGWLWFRSGLVRGDAKEASVKRADLPWLAAAILFGGVVGPVLLMAGLATTPAADASLLLNLEGVLTALLAWFVFKRTSTGVLPWVWRASPAAGCCSRGVAVRRRSCRGGHSQSPEPASHGVSTTTSRGKCRRATRSRLLRSRDSWQAASTW